jgi:hypothetical protein
VWLILLPVVVLLLVVTILVDLALVIAGARYHHFTALLFRCFEVLGATRGMAVRVRSDDTDVDICFA